MVSVSAIPEATPDELSERFTEWTTRRQSYSSINQWRTCPRQWYFQRIHKASPPESGPLFIGAVVHSALEAHLGRVPNERGMTDSLRADTAAAWDEHGGDEKAAQLDVTKETIWGRVENWLHLERHKFRSISNVQLEHKLLFEVEGVKFIGFIDRLDQNPDGTWNIIDYKTGRLPNHKYAASKFIQLQLYAWAINQENKVRQLKLVFLGDPTGTRTREFNLDECEAATLGLARDAQLLQEDAAASVSKVEDDAVIDHFWPPQVSVLCNWCPYQEHCPEGRMAPKPRNSPK